MNTTKLCPASQAKCSRDSAFCFHCGHRFEEAADDQLGHIEFLLRELDDWDRRGLLHRNEVQALRDEYVARRERLIEGVEVAEEPPPEAPAEPISLDQFEILEPEPAPAEPRPTPTAPSRAAEFAQALTETPPVPKPTHEATTPVPDSVEPGTDGAEPEPVVTQPSGLAAFLEEKNISWLYGFGALVLIGSEIGVIAKWGNTYGGKWFIALSLAALTAGCYGVAKWLLASEYDMRVGAKAFAVIGSLLLPLNPLTINAYKLLGPALSGEAIGLLTGMVCAPAYAATLLWIRSRTFVYLSASAAVWAVHSLLQVVDVSYSCYGIVFIPLSAGCIVGAQRLRDHEEEEWRSGTASRDPFPRRRRSGPSRSARVR